MAEYLPLHAPGQAFTRQASAAITGGQLLIVSGSGTVAPSSGTSPAWCGVAAFDAASGSNVTVYAGGIHRLTASGTVNAGDLVVAAASGAVSTLAAVTTPTAADVTGTRNVVGVALSTATNGNLVEIQMER